MINFYFSINLVFHYQKIEPVFDWIVVNSGVQLKTGKDEVKNSTNTDNSKPKPVTTSTEKNQIAKYPEVTPEDEILPTPQNPDSGKFIFLLTRGEVNRM